METIQPEVQSVENTASLAATFIPPLVTAYKFGVNREVHEEVKVAANYELPISQRVIALGKAANITSANILRNEQALQPYATDLSTQYAEIADIAIQATSLISFAAKFIYALSGLFKCIAPIGRFHSKLEKQIQIFDQIRPTIDTFCHTYSQASRANSYLKVTDRVISTSRQFHAASLHIPAVYNLGMNVYQDGKSVWQKGSDLYSKFDKFKKRWNPNTMKSEEAEI